MGVVVRDRVVGRSLCEVRQLGAEVEVLVDDVCFRKSVCRLEGKLPALRLVVKRLVPHAVVHQVFDPRPELLVVLREGALEDMAVVAERRPCRVKPHIMNVVEGVADRTL